MPSTLFAALVVYPCFKDISKTLQLHHRGRGFQATAVDRNKCVARAH